MRRRPLSGSALRILTLATQERFAPVQAGEMVTTGTLTAALSVSPGQRWTTVLDGIDLPGLSISFA